MSNPPDPHALTRTSNTDLNEIIDALDNVPDGVAIRAVALAARTGVDLRTAVFQVSGVWRPTA